MCVQPQLGSGPLPKDGGTGFYSVADYREILAYAEARHIEVIPEIDVPGHAHAPIKAMEKRYFCKLYTSNYFLPLFLSSRVLILRNLINKIV